MADVLVTAIIHPDALSLLRSAGLTLTECPRATYADASRLLPGHSALLSRVSVRIDEALLSQAPGLRCVGISSVGLDHVDLDAAKRLGVEVFNAAGGNAISVAEIVVAQTVNLLRELPRANNDMHTGLFDRPRYPGFELAGRTVGIIGLGAVGTRVARRMSAFDTRVIAYDPYVRFVYDPTLHNSTAVEMVSFERLLMESDVITVHAPLTDETYRMFAAEEFSCMKRTALFLNLARGPIVDEAALADALRNGIIAGAAVDVFEEEPTTTSPLMGMANCLLTPHLAGTPEEGLRRMGMMVAERIIDRLRISK